MGRRHGKKQRLQKKIRNAAAALCFTVALVLVLTSMGATLAKYRREHISSGMAAAAPFYFTSDKLSADRPYFQTDPADSEGMVEIRFTLSNFIDDLRTTDKEIRYTLRTLSGGSEIAGAGKQGTLSGAKQTEAVTLPVRASDFGEEGKVTVIAEATSPYQKEISAEFGLSAREEGLVWQVKDENGTVTLELAGGEGQSVWVSWPGGLVPDPVNSLLQSAEDGRAVFTAQAGERYALVFLKTSPETSYGKADFSVGVNE